MAQPSVRDRVTSDALAPLAAEVVLGLADLLAEEGPLFVVGGTVRDLLAGVSPSDLDVTSRVRPDRFGVLVDQLRIPGAAVARFDVGERHGTTGVLVDRDGETVCVEHTTHRVDCYRPGSRQPKVTFGDRIVDDLARRDFTVNAIAWDPTTGSLVDPFDGMSDLVAGRLRCPTDPERSFTEDPLRVCRLVRFAATRGWTPTEDTVDAARRCADGLDWVSPERIRAEADRVFAAGGAATLAAATLASQVGVSGRMLGVPTGALPEGLAGLDDPDAVRVVVALSSGNPRRWLSKRRDSNRMARLVCGAAGLVDRLAAGVLELTEIRRAGFEAARVAAAAGAAFGVDPGVLGHSVGAPELFGPLPVDGHDAIRLGLSGPRVGEALDAVCAVFCQNPSLSRDDAIGILSRFV